MPPRRKGRVLRWPTWLDQYEDWHPLASTAYDVYSQEMWARPARRYKVGRELLAPAYEDLKRFEDTRLPQRVRVAAGNRAWPQFSKAKDFLRERWREAHRKPMKLPVLRAKPVWPSKPLCPQCGKHKVMEPHSMAVLAGGALRVTGAKTRSAEMADDCIGFLNLTWHGAHDGGTGVDQDVFASMEVAEDTPNGQFEFYFCSTTCLRAFLDRCVNELEAKIREAQRRRMKKRKRSS